MVVGAPVLEVKELAGLEAIPTGLLENALLCALSELEMAVVVAVTLAEVPVGRMVVTIEKFVSVAMLERKLEACEALNVNVSDGNVVVPETGAKTVVVTVWTPPVAFEPSVGVAVVESASVVVLAVIEADVSIVEVAVAEEASEVRVVEASDAVEAELVDVKVEVEVLLPLPTGSLSSLSSQSMGKATELEMLLEKMPPVTPVASITANAVVLVVQEST